MKKLTLDEISDQRLTPSDLQSARRFPVYVLLDNIRSLYNVGAIFRTADAARVTKLLLCGITGYPPRKELDKTALGATETVPWQYYPDAMQAIAEIKSQQIPLVALEHTTSSKPHWSFDYPFPFCLVIGHEVWGIQQDILDEVDDAIEIPMFGAKHSLNASVAFAIAIYDALAKYQHQ